MPPLAGVAVKVTDCPAQVGLVPEVMTMETAGAVQLLPLFGTSINAEPKPGLPPLLPIRSEKTPTR